ncbi:MFS transporter [Nocardioides sp.]|uniref:MFS transporter n=1 Tax=Nocardioides sp. TaxID=35761 RepID=UPI002F4169BF
MTSYRDLARNHDFTILWVGETISELGSTMSLFVFPLLGYHLTGSTAVAALLEGAGLLGMVAMMLPAGVLADRYDRRTLMLAASAAGSLLYGSLAVAGYLGELTIPHLAVVALLSGVAQGVFQPAQMAAIRKVVSTEDLATAFSQNQARQHVASLVGGPLGGLLYAVRAWAPFVVDAISYCVSCLTLSRIRTDLRPQPRTGAPTRPVQQVKEGYRFIRHQPFFRTLMVWATINNLVINACFFVVIMRLVRDGVQPAQIGLVSTFAGVGGILGALAAPYVIDRLRTGTLTVLVGWMCVLPLVPLVWFSTAWAACASVFTLLLLNPAGNAGIGAYRAAMTPDELQGRVGSALSFAGMGAMPLAPVLGGLLLGSLGGSTAIAALVAATGLAAMIPTLSRSIRSVPRPAAWPRLEGGARVGETATMNPPISDPACV